MCLKKSYVLKGVNSDSGLTAKEATFEGISKYNVDNKILTNHSRPAKRVYKTSYELDVLKYVIETKRPIYEAVLAANLAVFKAGKPGVSWSDMHVLSNRVLLEQLKKGLLRGSVDEMMEVHLAAIFQPQRLGSLHGLGLVGSSSGKSEQSKFLVPEVIQRFRGFGGVRIEDDVLVTKNGILNLTKVPRAVEEIENWIAGKEDERKYA
ncbi:hypothetical protein NQ318_013626 [Aromia moschata]|uniref:Peptidase M24 domain-containing protein n=1 Tax=Aromia moschata TaxID=1265417 RepID=A0AAV8YKX5_9CUCU|nr:hypothetical protein NQ318_013626 [Aromia moschata]